MTGTLYITGDAAADNLLNTDANALLLGMLLDQQIPKEWAFAGPSTLKERLGHLDPGKIAAMPEDDFVSICCEKPAIHRFPGSMGKRIHQVCAVVADQYDGDAANLWTGVDSGKELFRRLKALPGYGDEKSKIFVAILGKTQGVAPEGWRNAAGKFGDDVVSLVPWHDSNKPLSKTLEAYFAKHHPDRQVNPNHTYTFEGIMIAADAYKRAGSTNAKTLQAALRTTNITNNVTTAERIAFEPNGQNKYVKNSAVQNRGGKNLVILPQSAAVAKPIWPMRGWKKRG